MRPLVHHRDAWAVAACLIGLSSATVATPVYRCGDLYTDEPCPNGRVVDVADPRSPAQAAEAREALRREAADTERLTRQREAAEARAARAPAAIAPMPAQRPSAKAPQRAARDQAARPPARARTEGQRGTANAVRRASDRPGDADDFVAFTPGEAAAGKRRKSTN